MKYCPTCQSQYTDDTLRFCLQDGTPLQNALFSQTPSETAGETETLVAPRPTDQAYVPRDTGATVYPTGAALPPPSVPTAAPPAARSKTATAVFLTAFAMLVFFALAGIVAWFYFNGLSRDRNANLLLANANRANSNAARNSEIVRSTPPATTAANTAATANANANANSNTNALAPADRERIREEVGARVEEWASQIETLDLDEYMENYAETVDYYNRRGASRAFVRADKERAFGKFDAVEMQVGDVSVTPDASGSAATAVFDKQWRFSGPESASAGKVQTQLRFKKVGGRWLIASERDLKVYYTE